MLVGIALGAVVVAIAGGDDEEEPAQASLPEPPPPVQPQPLPPLEPPQPSPPPSDDKGYPAGTKERFIDVCSDQAPLSDDQCGCVYDRLHDKYDYDEFRRLVREIDPEARKVPQEILDEVIRCRLPQLPQLP